MAFEAFACEQFDTGRWLRADYAVRCDGSDYASVRTLAVVALLLYPIGIPLAYTVLLFLARRALLDSKPTVLSTALTFLHGEYHTRFFWWELAEVRRDTAERVHVERFKPRMCRLPCCILRSLMLSFCSRRCCAAFSWSVLPS